MREADTEFFRGMSIAGFFVILCIMLIFAVILGPAKRITGSAQSRKGHGVRDLELGDLECERQRGGVHDRGLDGKLDRGMPHPDEYDIFANPWKNKSLESVRVPEPVHMPISGGGSRGFDIEPRTQRGLDLPDPDIFNLPTSHVENPFADPIPEPAPKRPGLISFQTFTRLGPRLMQWKAQALSNVKDDRGKARDIEDIPTTADGAPDLAALSAAVAATRTPPYDPLPDWLTTPKASAGPRAARFSEVDVDGATVTPPDHEFVAEQHEMLMRVPIPARPGMPRSSTWHPASESGEELESSRPVVARNQTFAG